MNRNLWIEEDLDLKAALDRNDYDTLFRYSMQNRQNILMYWLNHDFSTLEKVLRTGSFIMHYFERSIQEFPLLRTVFKLGTLSGTVENFDALLSEKIQNEHVIKDMSASLSSIKHFDDIVKALEQKGMLNHSQLCAELGLKDSALTEIMKKILPTSAVLSSRSGKFKLYSLSDFGHRYANQLIEKQSAMMDECMVFAAARSYQYDKRSMKSKERPSDYTALEAKCYVLDLADNRTNYPLNRNQIDHGFFYNRDRKPDQVYSLKGVN